MAAKPKLKPRKYSSWGIGSSPMRTEQDALRPAPPASSATVWVTGLSVHHGRERGAEGPATRAARGEAGVRPGSSASGTRALALARRVELASGRWLAEEAKAVNLEQGVGGQLGPGQAASTDRQRATGRNAWGMFLFSTS